MDGLSDNTKMHIKFERLCIAVENSTKEQEKIAKTVYGDGNGSKGLLIKVDRLIQSQKFITWIGSLVGVTTIGFILKAIWEKYM